MTPAPASQPSAAPPPGPPPVVTAPPAASAVATDDAAETSESALGQKLRSLAALAVPALMFWYVGHWAVQPDDPAAPFTLLLVPNRLLAMAELLGLSIVGAGLAAAIQGPRGALYAPMGVAVGIAALAVRGGATDALPMCLPSAAPAWPTRSLVFELWLWLILIGVGAIIGRWVEGWSHSAPEPKAADWRRGADAPVDSAAELRRALGAIAMVVLGAYLLNLILGGSPNEQPLKGQVYFAVGAAFFIPTWIATGMLRLNSPLWLLGAVAIVGTVAYLCVGPIPINPDAPRALLRVLLPNAIRPLPAEYAALGSLGVIYGFLSTDMLDQSGTEEKTDNA